MPSRYGPGSLLPGPNRKEVENLKRAYKKPTIVEYGPMRELTLGQNGTSPDYYVNGSQLININNNCTVGATGPNIVCS